jgi:hypothetical protein
MQSSDISSPNIAQPDGGNAALRSILVRQAFTAIDTAATVDDLRKVLDEWTGLAAYARAAKDQQLEADAAEIKMRAERRLGEMMKAQKEAIGFHQGGRPKTGSATDPVSAKPVTLAEAGIDKHLADRARKGAAKPEEQFKEDVREKKHTILKRVHKPKTVNSKPSPDIVDGCVNAVGRRVQDTVHELDRRNRGNASKRRAELERLFAGLIDTVVDLQRKTLLFAEEDAAASAEKRKALYAAEIGAAS